MGHVAKSLDTQYYISSVQMVPSPYRVLATVASGCIVAALQWEQYLLHTILKLQRTTKIFIRPPATDINKLGSLDVVTDYEVSESRVDVRDVENLKVIGHAGKKGKKGGKGGAAEEKKRKAEEEKAAKKRAEEEQRLRKWEEDWDKKLAAQEALDDRTCCMQKGFCLKPKTQSNLWIKVTQEKTIQDVQMAFKHVPVPKPKAPPLPKLKIEEPPPKPAAPKKGKGKGKGKKKK